MSVGLKTSGKKYFLLTAVFTAAVLLCAGEADERKLGDQAFYSGDFATAISHYRSARKLSEGSFFSEPWIKSTLKLGRAQLLSGDIEGAKKTLEEFRMRYPLHSAGTLPADILAASGDFSGAEKLYLAMENSEDLQLAGAAGFGRAVMRFNQGKFAEAEALFRKLLNVDDLRLKAAVRRELAYTLIRQKKCMEALDILGAVPAEFRNSDHAVLTALAEVNSGQLDNFRKNWHELVKNHPRFPDRRCCELLLCAADAFEKQNDRALSAEILKAADRFAATPQSRQNILKQLINLESSFDPESAAESAVTYGNLFPDAADRYQLVISAAGILADAGKLTAAAELLEKLLADKTLPETVRYQASGNGAGFAEKSGNIELASAFYAAAVSSAPSDTDKVASMRKYAAFFMRQKDYRKAVAVLLEAVGANRSKSGDDLKEELLDAAVKDRNAAVTALTAKELKNSPVPRYRARAHYELAELAKNKRDFALARKEFLAAAAIRNAGQYARAGRFGAVFTAFQSGDFKNCAVEALSLAVEYPRLAQAPQVLYLAYRSARQLNDAALKKQAAELLTAKYPESESYAVYALQNAADRANINSDFSGAAADLEALEKQFAKFPEIVTEAMLLRGNILKTSGKPNEALKCLYALIEQYPESSSVYYAAMLAGNINFSMLEYAEALKYFDLAASKRSAGLENELARSMAVESMFQLNTGNAEKSREAFAACDKLIAESKFAHIRMEMRYSKAVALQNSGKNNEALTVYEQLLNEAVVCAVKGQPYDRNRCLRAGVAALQIVNSGNKRSLYMRGLRIIERCKRLKLDDAGLDPDALRTELIQKFSSKRKRR